MLSFYFLSVIFLVLSVLVVVVDVLRVAFVGLTIWFKLDNIIYRGQGHPHRCDRWHLGSWKMGGGCARMMIKYINGHSLLI